MSAMRYGTMAPAKCPTSALPRGVPAPRYPRAKSAAWSLTRSNATCSPCPSASTISTSTRIPIPICMRASIARKSANGKRYYPVASSMLYCPETEEADWDDLWWVMIPILIADDHGVLRAGLRALE